MDLAEELSLGEFSDIVRSGLIEALTNPSVSEPEALTLGGQPAIRYEIVGVIDNVKIRYWHVSMESEGHFHQVILWSLPSKFEKNRPDFEAVLQSIRKRAA
jgi:hypothetical protein